ncbi:MAG TPA: hypothetical protein DCX06_02955 [Opitutae bacterium]|nr:hypothetical protein [Opitutae bacterium]
MGQLLLSSAVIILLAWQLSISRDVHAVLESAKEQRAVIIEQATTNQAKTSQQLESFLSDLLMLADNDAQAAAVVQKYGIKRNTPDAPAN